MQIVPLSFLVTALLLWRSVIGTRGAGRLPYGFGVMLVFAMALHVSPAATYTTP